MLRFWVLTFLVLTMPSYNSAAGLAQYTIRTLNRNTQYNFDDEHNQFNEKEYRTAMITGHRSAKNCLPEMAKLVTMAVNLGVTNFLCGMALGADQCAAELLIMRGLKWTAVIPCGDQDKLWKPHQRSKYRKLLKEATDQITLYPEYSAGVMHARNLWMVKRSQICLAVLSSFAKPGGSTRSTVQMALDRNLLVYRFDPEKQEYSMVEPLWKQLTLNLNG